LRKTRTRTPTYSQLSTVPRENRTVDIPVIGEASGLLLVEQDLSLIADHRVARPHRSSWPEAFGRVANRKSAVVPPPLENVASSTRRLANPFANLSPTDWQISVDTGRHTVDESVPSALLKPYVTRSDETGWTVLPILSRWRHTELTNSARVNNEGPWLWVPVYYVVASAVALDDGEWMQSRFGQCAPSTGTAFMPASATTLPCRCTPHEHVNAPRR